ncbi:MAG: exosome complex protein Rrp42 [Desulfurococcales archaeon]|nr:exosome complex protein Rrp42 [Desulfurococcales archaeon]
MSTTPYKLPIVPMIKKQSYLSLYRKGARIDGRDLETPRNVRIETGVIEKAEGSAIARLGNTQVIAGVKIDVGSPFRDTPDQGVLTVHAEFVPLASPLFEPGPPDENAVELARVVDRSLREVGAVDLSSLAIRPGEKVWMLWVDLYILDHDGNLFDASMLAAMAALLDARLPEYEELESGEIMVDKSRKGEPLKIDHRVVTVTIAKVDEYLIVDPTLDEETIADAKIVVAVDEEKRIVGAQKTGGSGMTREEILKAVDIAGKASEVYFKALNEAISKG